MIKKTHMHVIKTWKVWKSIKKEVKKSHIIPLPVGNHCYHPGTRPSALILVFPPPLRPKQLHSLYVDLELSSTIGLPEAQKWFKSEHEGLYPLGRVKMGTDGFPLHLALPLGRSKSFL